MRATMQAGVAARPAPFARVSAGAVERWFEPGAAMVGRVLRDDAGAIKWLAALAAS